MAIVVGEATVDKGVLCERILRALPEWFGIEESLLQYAREVEALPVLVATAGDRPVGLLSLKAHATWSIEVHVMGVLPEYHRAGVGRLLMAEAEARARAQGFPYLTVKTLSPRHPDPGYARTRAFYQAMGFRPLEELPDPHNPLLIMIKPL